MELSLNLFEKPRPTKNLRIQTLGWQKQDAKIGRAGRCDVFLLNCLGALLNSIFKFLPGPGDTFTVTSLGGRNETPVILVGKLRIDRQQNFVLAVSARQSDRKFHSL